ncbi:MAG: rhamnulokinase [Phycisphaera sp.]|nr:rhamnulokinase [Phycisphaera sp.]
MTATRRHIAIDLGASSGRVMEVVIGDDGLSVRELHRFANAPVAARRAGNVTLCWPFERLWESILDGLRAAAAEGPADSIGVDSWAVDYALLDDSGELVRPIAAYRDSRTKEPFARLRAELGDERIYADTGIAFQPFNTLYQLAADAADPMRPLDRAARMLMLPDYIAFRLCGATVCERTNASSTQMLDAATRAWNLDLVAATGASTRILPELVDAGDREPLGTLLRDVADETGLSASTTVFATATHDTASAVIAAPIDPARDLYVSSGTWSLVGLELPHAVTSAAARAANMTNELGAFGSVRFLRNVAGLWLVQQCEAAFAALGRGRSWSELAALAREAEPLASLVDPNDPAFFEPGDMPARIRAACAARGEPVPDSDAAIIRCAIDSIAIATARAAREAASLAGREPRQIAVVGGGGANELLNQLVADASGLPVEAGPAEATAIGNALMQHAALEEIGRASELRALVRASAPIRRYEPDFAQSARMRAAAERVAR